MTEPFFMETAVSGRKGVVQRTKPGAVQQGEVPKSNTVSGRVWRTFLIVKIGEGKTCSYYTQAFASAKILLDEQGKDVLKLIDLTPTSSDGKDVRLVTVSVKQLGFKEVATYQEICDCAQRLGLEFCPGEAALQLPLTHKMSVKKWGLVIAMKPITDNAGFKSTFFFGKDASGIRLDGHNAEPDSQFCSNEVFVFAKRSA